MKSQRDMKRKAQEITDSLIVRHQKIPVVIRSIEQTKLRFYPDNPRIYSLLRRGEREPTQGEIEKRLLEKEHVKELIQDIKRNGGLIEPLIVKDESFEVLEGNSRLAAYRFLARTDPIKWGLVKCTVLPSNVSESLVFAILGQHHIRGKKDWAPYEQAGFLYRRHKNHKVELDTLSSEIGLSRKMVKHLIDTYQFMLNHKETDINRWSYYDEYLKSSKIGKVRKTHPTMDNLVVAKIKSSEIGRAVEIRDQLPVVCSGSPKNLKRFLAGKTSLAETFLTAQEAGGDNSYLKRLVSFRNWVIRDEVKKPLTKAKGKCGARSSMSSTSYMLGSQQCATVWRESHQSAGRDLPSAGTDWGPVGSKNQRKRSYTSKNPNFRKRLKG